MEDMVILQPNFTAAVDAPIPFLFMLCVLGGAPLSSAYANNASGASQTEVP